MAVYLRAEAENCLQPDTQQCTVVFLYFKGRFVCLYFYDRLIIFVCECGFILVGYNRSIKVRCQYSLGEHFFVRLLEGFCIS